MASTTAQSGLTERSARPPNEDPQDCRGPLIRRNSANWRYRAEEAARLPLGAAPRLPLGAAPRVAAPDERIQRGHAHALAVGRVEAPRQPFVVIDVPVRTMSGTDTLWELHRER